MPITVATHNGPFHADDVVAFALVRLFLDDGARVVRTRDPEAIDAADLVLDVGGVFDPAACRFDHHQHTYTGTRSTAGMVLDWLADEGRMSRQLAAHLRTEAFDYLDAVDNGQTAPRRGVPCFPQVVDAFNQKATTHAEFDARFAEVSTFAAAWLEGLVAEHERIEEARSKVRAAMERADAAGSNLLELEAYCRWKEPYYELGGEEHRTEFALFPGTDDRSYRVIAIPPRLGDFGQKRSFPEAWAGLTDEALCAVIGVPGAKFCHKNLFIAVFEDREHALEALRRWELTGG